MSNPPSIYFNGWPFARRTAAAVVFIPVLAFPRAAVVHGTLFLSLFHYVLVLAFLSRTSIRCRSHARFVCCTKCSNVQVTSRFLQRAARSAAPETSRQNFYPRLIPRFDSAAACTGTRNARPVCFDSVWPLPLFDIDSLCDSPNLR
jgi:hypothetical protein